MPQSSPSKRPRIVSEDDDEADELQRLKDKITQQNLEISQLKAKCKELYSENKALQLSDARITEQYQDIKEDSRTHQKRDRRVITELNTRLSKLQTQASSNAEAVVRSLDMSNLLNTFAKLIETTIPDVTDDMDGTEHEDVQCPICLEAMVMQKCSLLHCGHFFHSVCVDMLNDAEDTGRIACPTCRTYSRSEEIIKKLRNFDEGWEKLIALARKWKGSQEEEEDRPAVPAYRQWTAYEDQFLSTDDDAVPISDDYASTDNDEIEEVRIVPAKSASPTTDDDSDLNDVEPVTPPTPSAARRRKMEELAAKRAQKRRI